LHNCPISTTYVVDPKSLPTLGISIEGDKLWVCFFLDSLCCL
jgi:hypothetical protein